MFLSYYSVNFKETLHPYGMRVETHGRVEKGFRLSRTKIEYMMCDFTATRYEGGDVSLDGQWWLRRILFGI